MIGYTSLNPTGHYKITLTDSTDLIILKDLLMCNIRNTVYVSTNNLSDVSQKGNKSCFRNEKHNGAPVEIKPGNGAYQIGLFHKQEF
jgi:hypothetical protein